MKFNTTIFLLLFIICNYQLSYSQDTDQPCSCLLLKESEENDEKVIELAEYIETSFHNLSSDAFNEKFDVPSFLNSIIDQNQIDKKDGFTRGYIEGISSTGKKLSQQITNSIEAGAYYNLINYRYNVEDMAYYFTFRLYSDDIGVNYHDYKVCSDGEHLKFNDIYIYITGEPLSSTLQRIFLVSKPPEESPNSPATTDATKNIFYFVASKKLAEQGKHKEAYDKISQLTAPMSTEKFILLIKANYASTFDDELYENALKEYADLYPQDPTLYLKKIDYNIIKGDYNKAIQNIDKLIFETEDDFLNLIKANVYVLDKDYKNAEIHYEYIVENYPDLLQGYIGYIIALNFQNRFEEIIVVIEDLIEQGYDKDALLDFLEEKEPDGTNELEAFVKSKLYKKWKRKS